MVTEIAKSQWVRLYNVVFMCPYMMYLSNKYDMKGWMKTFMIGGQILTWLYNFKNLIQDKKTPKQPYPKIPMKLSSKYEYPEDHPSMANTMRLLDVFAYGPACMLIAKHYEMEPFEEVFMWYTGISTVGLNGWNYLENKKLEKKNG